MRLARTLLLFAGTAAAQSSPELPVAVASLRALQANHATASIRGTVTRTAPTLFVQDATGGVAVLGLQNPAALHVGDQVVVTGRAEQERYDAAIYEPSVRLLSARVPAPPLAVTAEMASSGRFSSMFVEAEGRVLEKRATPVARQLLLRSGRQMFLADLYGRPSWDHIALGSIVRVRGICSMADETLTDRVPFRILMRSAADVEVVAAPPFWTAGHLVLLVLALLVLAVAFQFAYHRLQRWRFRLLLDDRTRAAHDLHDTLAQSFAGVAFQLQAVKNAMGSANQSARDPALGSYVDMAISMVSHSHEDARRAIAMLKPVDAGDSDLLQELEEQGVRLTRGGDLRFESSAEGEVCQLTERSRGALLRIGHEAITNAVRHASPRTINLALLFDRAAVTLRVADDGCGFRQGDGRRRGFGIAGMRARAASLGGTLEVTSEPGQGTTVEARLPLSTPVGLQHRVRAALARRRSYE